MERVIYNKVNRPEKAKVSKKPRNDKSEKSYQEQRIQTWGHSKVDKSLYKDFTQVIQDIMGAGETREYFMRVNNTARYHFENDSPNNVIAEDVASLSKYNIDIIDVQREIRRLENAKKQAEEAEARKGESDPKKVEEQMKKDPEPGPPEPAPKEPAQ